MDKVVGGRDRYTTYTRDYKTAAELQAAAVVSATASASEASEIIL
eukprot:gene10300-2446_t